MHSAMPRIWLASLVALLQGCVYVPRTTERFDEACQAVARRMVLDEVQVASINGCANEGCLALVVAASAVTAVSVVVSGTIVVAGNVVYWFERRTQCASAS